MAGKLLTTILLFTSIIVNAQQLQLIDRFNGNKIVNDSVITVYSSDPSIIDLTRYFTMKNNTDRTLALFLRKTVNMLNDSTTDYFCFGIKCWPDTYRTDVADTILPGAEDYTFASHVVHVRRFETPPLPPGRSSITYTIYDSTAFPEPVEASVTVIYHLSGLGVNENQSVSTLVYPNPAAENITVVTHEYQQGNLTLSLFDGIGLLIRQSTVLSESNEVTIPVDGLTSGLYYGHLVSDEGKATTFKFLVNH